MLRYTGRRLMIAIVAIFVLATITFFLMRLVPGDPFAGPRVAPEIRAALREHYGLNLPLIQQYWIYMSNLLHGDLGLSLASRGHPVTDIILQAAPVSLDLGIRAMILSITAGLFLGIVAALNRGKPLDYLTVILVLIGIELMLNAANLNFIAFWRYGPHPEALTGVLFTIFSIAVAAAEAAVGLALILVAYRHFRTTNLDRMNRLKG